MRWLALALAGLVAAAPAATVNLAWEPVDDARLTAYELGWGSAPGKYEQFQLAPRTTGTLDLPDDGASYIAVRALGLDGGEPIRSGWSNEVVWTLEREATQPLAQSALFARYALTEDQGMATRVQYKGGNAIGSDPGSVTLDSAPTEGNLLVVIVSERSGTSESAFVMGSSGWTKLDGADINLTDLYDRFSLAVFSKIAGASESATITADNGTSNTKYITAMEFAPGSGESFTFHAATDNQDTTPLESDSLGTGSVSSYSGNALIISWVAIKTDLSHSMTSLSFATAGDAAIGPEGTDLQYTNIHGAGYIGSGTAVSDTATWVLTDSLDDPRSAAAGIVVFTLNAAAVARTGPVVTHQDNADSTISFTVPSDANAIVVYCSGYLGTADDVSLFAALNFDGAGADFVSVVRSGYYAVNNAIQIEALILTSASAAWPGAGAQTLTWAPNGSTAEGYNIAVQAYSGVDTTSPVVGTDRSAGTSSAWTSAIAGVGANDLGVIAAYKYNNTPASLAINGQSQFVSLSSYNSAGLAVADEVGEGALSLSASSDQVPLAFVLRAGSVSATTSFPLTSYTRRMAHLLGR